MPSFSSRFRRFARLASACAGAAGVFLPAFLKADTLTLAPTADGYIRASQSASQTANTINGIFLVGDTTTASDYLRGVLSFDLNQSVLVGATINGVSLVLTVNDRDASGGGGANAARTINLHPVTPSFTEAAVSWTSRDGTNNWTAAGGDFGALLASASANPATVNAGDTLTFTGAALASSVHDSVGGPLRLLVKLATENTTRAVFRLGSREGTPANVPRLVIDYTPSLPPEPVTSSVTPVPGHPESSASTRYTVSAGGQNIPVKAERYGFDVALFTLGAAPAVVDVTMAAAFTDYTLKPARHNLAVTRVGNTLRFTLAEPLRLVLQIPGLTPLAIIVTPPEVSPPSAGDPDVLYFGPGTTVAGVIRPTSNQTVYLAPGALVKGRIEALNVSHVTVKGRGILETEGYSVRADQTPGILFGNSSDVTVEGIGVRSYYTYWQTLFRNSRSVTVANLNIFGLGVNTDGVDIDAVKDFVVRDSFIRSEDDGLGWHSLDAAANGESITERVLADNIVIWNTGAGNGVRIGASMEAQLWRDITLRHLDILYHAGSGLYSDYSDWAWMQNLRFEDVAIERATSPVTFQIAKTGYSNNTGFLDERGHFDGLVFQNLTAAGGTIKLSGYDSTHRIDHVRFINSTNAGVPLSASSQLTLNSYVTDLAFDQDLPAEAAADPGVYEAEDQESLTNRTPQYVAEDASAGQGRVRVFLGSATGDYVEHTLDVPTAGTYTLKIRVRQTPASGRAQLTLNGVPVGPEREFYAAATAYQEFDYGDVVIPSPGPQALRLTITGRNPASAGCRLDIDRFKLLTPLQAWRDRYFATTADAGSAADAADPDSDGAPDLLEFATGTSPLSAQPAPAVCTVASTPEGNRLSLTFTRLQPAPLTYVVEASSDLVTWLPVATLSPGSTAWIGTASALETIVSDSLRKVTITDSETLASSNRRFLRLKVVSS